MIAIDQTLTYFNLFPKHLPLYNTYCPSNTEALPVQVFSAKKCFVENRLVINYDITKHLCSLKRHNFFSQVTKCVKLLGFCFQIDSKLFWDDHYILSHFFTLQCEAGSDRYISSHISLLWNFPQLHQLRIAALGSCRCHHKTFTTAGEKGHYFVERLCTPVLARLAIMT